MTEPLDHNDQVIPRTLKMKELDIHNTHLLVSPREAGLLPLCTFLQHTANAGEPAEVLLYLALSLKIFVDLVAEIGKCRDEKSFLCHLVWTPGQVQKKKYTGAVTRDNRRRSRYGIDELTRLAVRNHDSRSSDPESRIW
ncbi:hypothetical protein HYFRA_00012153 [Hymenoscyphus fraxineus]|uniref:Uncharacterized protein n=1 Tax=Hymenoscyphus fraxineus TaxID=746836 RepID=A0A9N9L3V8_9HELO|nr:hypothetical protein HYFRA_00012153 [Hymenoscyphus fraxineus]